MCCWLEEVGKPVYCIGWAMHCALSSWGCTCRLGCCLDYRSLCIAVSLAAGLMQTFHRVIHVVCLHRRAIGVQSLMLICSSTTGAMLLGWNTQQTQVPRLVCLRSMALAQEPS